MITTTITFAVVGYVSLRIANMRSQALATTATSGLAG